MKKLMYKCIKFCQTITCTFKVELSGFGQVTLQHTSFGAIFTCDIVKEFCALLAWHIWSECMLTQSQRYHAYQNIQGVKATTELGEVRSAINWQNAWNNNTVLFSHVLKWVLKANKCQWIETLLRFNSAFRMWRSKRKATKGWAPFSQELAVPNKSHKTYQNMSQNIQKPRVRHGFTLRTVLSRSNVMRPILTWKRDVTLDNPRQIGIRWSIIDMMAVNVYLALSCFVCQQNMILITKSHKWT